MTNARIISNIKKKSFIDNATNKTQNDEMAMMISRRLWVAMYLDSVDAGDA
ncbi:hypothetical protein [Poriferisphaera corsica]|uniref:hypothetical protein n=1 Tax=Poriferisphaera corsica TaxID=2528020 RepID=UPI00190B2477|nr:hypothetical protein [Poriferisphaera corsica]